ncbi:hypothetical protein TRSC58_01484 [Trypanosoma rangeli SC58]|uniref:CH-like domain-containing protein n=1 Tax=Trypanosoma rangeli SC58 TaxID=429131 RepID=A0A061JBX1_TRYRA|nr:hypothetical protein TRSC58_01484 [Trypanosoma rangeli SC58]
MASSPELRRPPQHEEMPREVVAWMHTLHLPRVVRRPRRDLSNGFLVAVICSRYWSSISMHSYEDKMSAAQKRSNWELLQKQFTLNNCPLSDRMIEGMMACREDYANSFLRQLYTHLTGRVIAEAAPLPAEEVALPKGLLPQSMPPVLSTKINVEFNTPALDNTTRSTTRVRELWPSNTGALASPDRILPVAVAKRPVIHAIAEDQASGDAGDEVAATSFDDASGNNGAADKKQPNGKPPMDFFVSLRPAEVRQTVVRPAPKDNKQTAARDGQKRQKQQQEQPDDLLSLTKEVTALGYIEFIVQTQAADQGWSCARDVPAPFTEYFLREEANLGALLQRRLWSALLGSVSELTERVLSQGGSMADVTALFLRRPPPEEAREQPSQQWQRNPLQPEDASAAPRLWKKETSSRGNLEPQRFVFLASLLSSISDADNFLAISVYCDDVLPYSAEVMGTLDNVTANAHALLLCAALPANRKLAARLLPDVLVAVYTVVTESNTVEVKRSYYILLRAVLLRLARTVCRTLLLSTQSSSFSTANATLSATAGDPLVTAAFEIIGPNVLAALSHECFTVRLVGAHLAEALASTSYPTERLLKDILPLLSACRTTASPIFNCVCAAWLRIAMKCFSDPQEYALFAAEGKAADKETLCARTALHLATMMRHLSDALLAPGRLNVKTYIAKQLALCLDDIPDDGGMRQLFNPEKVARSVFSVLQSVPAELVAGFFISSSSAEGGVRVKGGANGQMALASVSCPLLGPLPMDGSLRDCYPLALSEAVLLVFPPEADGRRPSTQSEQSRGTVTSRVGGVEESSMRTRLITAKAARLLRDREVPEDVAQRVTWMYKVIVACRNGFGFPARPASLSEATAAKRWAAVMRLMYRDIAVLSTAAEMLCAPKGGVLTDDATNTVAKLAGMAQQIVLRWHTELTMGGPQLLKNSNAASPTTSERMTGAMTWYHNSFAESQPQQSRRVSSVTSRASERKR